MAICSKCGKEVPDGSEFCTVCGEAMEPALETASDTVDETASAEVPEEEGTTESIETTDGTPGEVPLEKSGNGKKIGIIAGVIALVAVAGVFAMTILKPKADPKEVVIAAFKSVYQDKTTSQLDEILGLTEMGEAMQNKNSEFGLTLAYNGSNGYGMDAFKDFAGSSMELVSKNEVEPVRSYAWVGFKYRGMDFIHSEAYMDDTELMVAVPEMSKKVFTINYADDLEGQIQNSPFLGQYLGDANLEAYFEYLETLQNSTAEDAPFDLKALWERYKTGAGAMDELKAAMTVTEADKAVKMVDGKDENCKVYEAVIPGIAFVDFARSTSDFFLTDEILHSDMLEYMTSMLTVQEGMNPYGFYNTDLDKYWKQAQLSSDELWNEFEEILKDDVNMLVYVDSKGRLAGLELETKITYEEARGEDQNEKKLDMKLDASLKGGDYLTQNAEAVITLYDDETTVTFVLDKSESFDGKALLSDANLTFTVSDEKYPINYSMNYTGAYHVEDGDYQVKFTVDADETKLSLTVEGDVLEYEKGKMMEVTADSIKVQSDEDFVEFSGRFLYKPLEGEVTKPEGTPLDILAATEADFTNVAMEIYMNSMGLSSIFQ